MTDLAPACPTERLKIIERVADEFDEEAVEKFLAEKQKAKAAPQPPMDCGCASTQIKTFAAPASSPCASANKPSPMPIGQAGDSLLTHWPIQIRLIPPQAPFLKGADVLVAADCTAVSVPGFQEKYLDGKVVMMGCPKFDDAQSYVDRFAEIIDTCNLKSITILIMEVPCCSAMNVIIRRAIDKATKAVPVQQITISTRGQELERKTW